MQAITQNLSSIPSDFFLILGILIACLTLAFALGKSRMTAFILSFYPAILIYFQIPSSILERLTLFKNNNWQIFFNNLVVFLVFFLLTFFIINTITGRSLIYSNRKSFIQLLALSVSASTLILVIINQVIVLPDHLSWLPLTGPFFSSEKLFFWLLAIPLALVLIFIRK